MRAQGALEYLIIIAAVLGISAVVVLFVGSAFIGSSGGADVSKCKLAAANCQRDLTLGLGTSCAQCDAACKDKGSKDAIDGSDGCSLGCLLCKKGANIFSYGPMNLKGYWKFDETSGSSAKDYSMTGSDLSLGGPYSWVPGKVGNALSLSGSFSYATGGTNPNSAGSVSIAAWVYPRARTSDRATVITKKNSAYLTIDNSGYVAVYFYGLSSPGYHLSNSVVPLNAWTHIATTYDSSNGQIKIYVNSKLETTVATTGTRTTSSIGWWLGAEPTTTRFLNGIIDEARLFEKALSAEEIKMLYDCC